MDSEVITSEWCNEDDSHLYVVCGLTVTQGKVMSYGIKDICYHWFSNGFSPTLYLSIIWSNAASLLIEHLKTNFSEIWINYNYKFANVVCIKSAILFRSQYVKESVGISCGACYQQWWRPCMTGAAYIMIIASWHTCRGVKTIRELLNLRDLKCQCCIKIISCNICVTYCVEFKRCPPFGARYIKSWPYIERCVFHSEVNT